LMKKFEKDKEDILKRYSVKKKRCQICDKCINKMIKIDELRDLDKQ